MWKRFLRRDIPEPADLLSVSACPLDDQRRLEVEVFGEVHHYTAPLRFSALRIECGGVVISLTDGGRFADMRSALLLLMFGAPLGSGGVGPATRRAGRSGAPARRYAPWRWLSCSPKFTEARADKTAREMTSSG
jgi:hypothetical protein